MNTTLQIVYASTSGNTELVVEKAAEIFNSHGLPVSLNRAEITSIQIIRQNNDFLFATSTWEHGRINPFFDHLLEETKEIEFKGKRAGFIGLGDRRYEPVLFCGGMEQLRQFFLEKGGIEICEPLLIEGEPHKFLEKEVPEWINTYLSNL